MENLRNTAYQALRRTESFFKTDMVYLAKGGFWLSAGHVIQLLFGLVLLVAFANLLPKEAYGTYQFIISISAIIGTFTLTGMGVAVTQAVSRNKDNAFRYGFKIQMMWSLGIVIAAGVIASYYYLKGEDSLASIFLIVGALQPFISGFSLYRSFLIGKQLFRESSILGIFQKLLPFVAVLPALFFTDNPFIVATVYFGSHTLSLSLVYLYIIQKFNPSTKPEPEILPYSKHLSVMVTISKIAEHLDKVLIWHFLGAGPVAVYTIAQMPIFYIQGLFHNIHSLSFSKLANKNFLDLKAALLPKIRYYFYIVLSSVIIYILIAPIIFKVFLPAYTNAVLYSQLLALGLLAVPRTIVEHSFTAHKMQKELYIIHITYPIIRIAFLLLLLPAFQIWGAVIAVLSAEIYNTVLQWQLFSRNKSLK